MNNRFRTLVLIGSLLMLSSSTTALAYGYYYGHHGYGHHHGYGYHYGYPGYGHYYGYPGYGHYYGHHGYGYGYGYGYGSGSHYYNPVYGVLKAPAEIAYGVLSIPAHVLGSVTGHHGHDYSSASSPGGASHSDATPSGTYGGGDQGNRGATTGQGGWSYLADGQYSTALGAFAREAEGNPRHGVPKVGYALSAAAAGDYSRGVWAMRRAWQFDPQGVEYLALDARGQAVVRELADRYQQRFKEHADADSAFMVAALRYITQEKDTARAYLQEPAASADHSVSADNLRRKLFAEATGSNQ